MKRTAQQGFSEICLRCPLTTQKSSGDEGAESSGDEGQYSDDSAEFYSRLERLALENSDGEESETNFSKSFSAGVKIDPSQAWEAICQQEPRLKRAKKVAVLVASSTIAGPRENDVARVRVSLKDDEERSGSNNLSGTLKDIANMHKFLTSKGVYILKVFLDVLSPEKSSILPFLRTLFLYCPACIIYYTGHGRGNGGDWCLKDESLSWRELESIWSSGRRRLLVILDSCHSGAWKQLSDKNPEVTVAAACPPDAVTQDTENGGIFTRYLTGDLKDQSCVSKWAKAQQSLIASWLASQVTAAGAHAARPPTVQAGASAPCPNRPPSSKVPGQFMGQVYEGFGCNFEQDPWGSFPVNGVAEAARKAAEVGADGWTIYSGRVFPKRKPFSGPGIEREIVSGYFTGDESFRSRFDDQYMGPVYGANINPGIAPWGSYPCDGMKDAAATAQRMGAAGWVIWRGKVWPKKGPITGYEAKGDCLAGFVNKRSP